MVIFSKFLPLISLVIGTTALTFQITVLYPWHIELDNEFKQLKLDQTVKLDEYHKLKLERLAHIEEKLV
jgi:hypothetical protein